MKRWIAVFAAFLTLTAMFTLTPPAEASEFQDILELPNGFTPEGIAIADGIAYTGSLADGSIQQIDIRTGVGSQLAPSPGAGIPSIGMDTDAFGRLWVAGGGTAFFFAATPGYRVYDLDSGDTLVDREVETLGAAFLNDVIITDDAAWFTDTFSPNLVKVPIDPSSGAIGEPQLIGLAGDWVQNAEGPNANGIEVLADGSQLIVAQSAAADGNGAALYLVDPAANGTSRDAQRIGLDAPVAGADGLVLDGNTLYVVGAPPGVIEIELSSDYSQGSVAGQIAVDAASPTTAALVGQDLFVVDADFANFGDPSVSFQIVRVPVIDDGPGAPGGPADGDIVVFESASGRFLDADNSPGHPSVNSSRIARADDRWQLNQLDNGYWVIQNEALGLYLDADNAAQDWDVDLGPADNRGLVWEIMPVDGGYYVLRNVAFDRYLNHTPDNVNTTDVPTVDVHWNIIPADDAPTPPPADEVRFDEAVEGDISDDPANPVSIPLTVRDTFVDGTVTAGDIDYVTVNVPEGHVLAALGLPFYESGNERSFIAVQEGTVFTEPTNPADIDVANLLGYALFGDATVGGDNLQLIGAGEGAQGFTGPLPAGDYTFWIQETADVITAYSWHFVTVPAAD